jgi:hypothetical protein
MAGRVEADVEAMMRNACRRQLWCGLREGGCGGEQGGSAEGWEAMSHATSC